MSLELTGAADLAGLGIRLATHSQHVLSNMVGDSVSYRGLMLHHKQDALMWNRYLQELLLFRLLNYFGHSHPSLL